ncbi:hypothetical protein L202_05737 [Cryptococcus amylolentus CBS 6039]|uniref:Uncharacterized protein n=2 Tax=Cryptococcus amylolentus TaxID=104669 RepID=A0A1E3HLJ7_9TREE|nr:hypothetical protein L202_05737 [Cryptococcus amylolentus CBS 6039]ODN77218.1 hypothetical protein L202_05737 [Cryptococcus amylolentus CBS 6039]ODO05052.1 hypothetical protein I350_05665 [Cryptococcus amylolentus CBS 6273]
MSSLAIPHRLKTFFSGPSSETSPPQSKDWNVLEVDGWDMVDSTARYDVFDPESRLESRKETFIQNDEWRILLEDATGNAGVTTAPNTASIDEFNKTKQHMLSDPKFASRVTNLRNVIDVLSQGDNPSVKNGFTYWDGEYRMDGVRSGSQDGQQEGDRMKWTIRATRETRGSTIFFKASTIISERLEKIRKKGVLFNGSTEPIEGVDIRDYGVDNSTRRFVESATTNLDIQSFFNQQDSGQVVEGQSNSNVTRWDIEKDFDHSYLGFEGEHAFAIRKPEKATRGKPLSRRILGILPEDGYVEALTAAAQLLDAAPVSATGDCNFSYHTPSGYRATIGKRQRFMSGAEWLVSLGKVEEN